MNIFKPTLLVLVTTVACAAGGRASARSAGEPPPIAERQPNMETALARLREARQALERAEHDKGGWRAKAIEATSIAIRETERGIAFDDKH